MIKFDRVSYSYPDGIAAINNLSLNIGADERVAILGNNGSGKTTFALLVNGILRATSGKISVNDLNPAEATDAQRLKRQVGLVFQNPDNQLVSTTVEREIAFSLENMNIDFVKIRERVDQSLKFFGLAAFPNRLTSELSGGEKQRVALAAVMIGEPAILILDEPGSYLDESGKQLLTAAVARLLDHNKNLTVLRITQYSYVTEDYERIIVFEKGGILMDGKPSEIFARVAECQSAGIDVPLKYRIETGAAFPKVEIPSMERREPTGAIKSIALDSVSFGYGDNASDFLFRELNLKIEDSKIIGLVGPSGSGKSTLIQLMAGLLKPNMGRINYGGFKAGAGHLAVSFQHPERQFFLETVDKELRFGAENLCLTGIDNMVEGCYKTIGLPKGIFSERDPFTLSGGEKRRLAFGTILSLKPSFIFFDEPTCGLDFDGIKLFKKMTVKLHEEGIGIVIISHYGNIIFELADDIVVLIGGMIDGVGSKAEFFESYDYSAFLSKPEMVSYQIEHFGRIKYFTEEELAKNLGRG
ncbi:MAG: energy-coupling factor transporter ATPase [candidate division Zixibacteria bacterium]|nr:energy-coupling factor transporter ATPase [candidate division Zixibacteria bacterium]